MYDLVAEIMVALFALVGTLVSGVMVSQKTAWRIDQLEKKVEKHNNLLERFAVLERDNDTQWKRIDELKEEMERMRNEH